MVIRSKSDFFAQLRKRKLKIATEKTQPAIAYDLRRGRAGVMASSFKIRIPRRIRL